MRRDPNRYIFSSEITRRHQRSHKRRTAVLSVLLLLAVTFFLSNFLISNGVKTEDTWVFIQNLPADLEEYSILHLSDLHGARYGDRQKAIATALGSRRYSCVIMTGDMLGNNQEIEPLLELIALMPAETPKYYIPGHDGDPVNEKAHGSLSVYTEWAETLQKAGVQILDRPMSETRGKGTIWFIPAELYDIDLDMQETIYRRQIREMNERGTSLTADDAARIRALEYELERIEETRELKKQIRPEDIQIVVTHTPVTEEFIAPIIAWGSKEDTFSLRYASLILAGHYNGGQWRIPFVGALYEPDLGWFPPDEEIMGLNYVAGIPQYISPGLGSDPRYTWQPGRLFNSPVVTRIILTRYAR